MITGAHISCKIGAMTPVLVPGVQTVEVTDSTKELDGTTAEDGGYERPEFGLSGVELRMQLVVDIVAGDLMTITNGTEITHLKIYAHIDATTPIYDIATFRVFRSVPKGEVNGRFTYDVTGKSVGQYTIANPSALV